MDAPLYLPASAYEQPQSLPQVLSTRTSSLADLQADPEAVAILQVLLPSMAAPRSGPIAILIEPLSIRDASVLGGVKAEDVDRIEEEFAKINARRGIRR